jgi:hypothetical protein
MLLSKGNFAPRSRPSLSGKVDIGAEGEQCLDDIDGTICLNHGRQHSIHLLVSEHAVSFREW